MPPVPHRLLRAAVVGASATLLGAAGHALAGGEVRPLGVLVSGLALLGPAWLLAGRERGWIPIAAAQLAGQQAVHAVLGGTGGMTMSGPVPPDLMFHLHVVAAVLVAGWLRRGERHAWAVARRAARAVGAWLRRASAARPLPAATVAPRLRTESPTAACCATRSCGAGPRGRPDPLSPPARRPPRRPVPLHPHAAPGTDSRMTMLRRTVAAALVAGLAVLLTATPAAAHAKLESTTPAQGASLAIPPTTVSLTFGEPVTVGAAPIAVTGPGGARWKVGKASITDSTVSAPVTATGPAGAYTLAYTVISDDGDAISGKVAFTLTAAATPTTAPAPTTTAAPTPTAAPTTTAGATTPSPAAASTPSDPGGGVPAWVWVVVAVVAVGGIGAIVARSRRAGS